MPQVLFLLLSFLLGLPSLIILHLNPQLLPIFLLRILLLNLFLRVDVVQTTLVVSGE